MNTYEPTPTKRIKQRVSEELLRFIARTTLPERDIMNINDITEVSNNTMYIRLKSLFQRLMSLFQKFI